MKLFLFTTDPTLAQAAEKGGVYSLIVDWENQGKYARQAGTNFEINVDSPADVTTLKQSVKLPITVRINSVRDETPAEIELALQAGADIIMLPMAKSAAEVAYFLRLVNQRAKTLVQIETLELIEDLDQFATLDWDFTYIGLNDLMISRGGKHIWETLIDGTVEKICAKLKGREYGFGGTTIVDGGKPLPFKLLLHEYTRLGCEISLMRRTFRREVQDRNIVSEIQKIHTEVISSTRRDAITIANDHHKLKVELAKLNKKVIMTMYSSHEVSATHIKRLKQLAPDYEIAVIGSEMEAQLYAPRASMILGHRYLIQSLPYVTDLHWVQTTAGGVDQLPLAELQNQNALLTRSTLSAPVIAQHAYNLYLSLLPDSVSSSQKTALIMGFGAIGQEIAQVLKHQTTLNYTVWAIKQQATTALAAKVDQLFTDDAWQANLAHVDVIFVSLPHTKQTAHFLHAQLLQRLPAHAIIVNVGRGETIDEAKIIDLLKSKKLAGFGTDVRGPYLKSLTANDLTNLSKNLPFIHTSHQAAKYSSRGEDIERFVEQQLASYLNGEKLKNEVNYAEY